MNPERRPCPECGSTDLHVGRVGVEGLGINLLPGTGSMGATIKAIVCSACGSMRYFVPEIQLARIRKSNHWREVDAKSIDEADDPSDRP